MRSIFKHIKDQDEFDQNGFLVLDALDPSSVQALKTYYSEHLNFTDESVFTVGLYMQDRERVVRMKEFIKEICIPAFSSVLGDIKFVTASFVVKFPSANGIVPVHQDWSFVDDEKNFYSTTCWIPLENVNIENGAIGIIKGSNHYFNTIRPSPSRYLKNDLSEYGMDIFPYMNLVEMNAGQALFFNNATFHGSPPNCSKNIRVAVGLSFTHQEAKTVHYYLNPLTQGTTAIKYEVNEEFFMKYSDPVLNGMFEKGELINDYQKLEEVAYQPSMIGKEKLLELVVKSNNIFNPQLKEKQDGSTLLSSYGSNINRAETSNYKENNPDVPEKWSFRKFLRIYTPKNIILEINYRIKKIFKST